MSGPYNYGFRPPHGQSPLSPETPTSAYKTNLGRKKTKKWVEAKAQNYDGDDWGNDFDDEEPEEPIPVPPLKPVSRQPSPSQATTANLPSNLPSHQPPAPQSAGLPTMRPPQPALNESGLSTSPRATAGLPPLQIQTPSSPAPAPAPAPARSEPQNVQPPIFSGPSSTDSVSDKGPYEQFVSPQSAHTGPTPEPSLVRNEQPQSVIPQNGGRRTSPAPAQPQSTRFPPRKSSMGQHDSDRLPSSRSSSTHPPQVEQRSGSPSGIISPGASSTSKPSFVRPSDIYRRVDNEKDRERGSMDSGRLSLDSSGGFKTDRSLSPAKPSPADTRSDEQVSGSSLGKPEGEDAIQGNLRPTLAPVAERKSEYGFHNVLMRPQTHAQNQTMPPSSESPNLGIPAPAPEPQIERPSEEEVAQQRRYSSSPRLPDLARMSLFGDDFFSNPGKFADDAPPMPALTPQLQAAAAASAPQHVGNPPAAPVALSTGSSTPQRADSPQVSEQIRKDLTPPAEVPRNQENVDSAKSDLASLPSRPSLPGGWVTETRSVTEEQTPPAVAEKKTLGVDPGEVSPISDNEHDEVPGSGVTIVKGVASMPIPISNASGQPMPASSQASEESHSADAPVHPLAPLNAGHSDSSSSRFVAPERLQRESTMSTVTSPSPVKESDKLREEIMRSLSPVRPTSDFDSFNGNRAGQSEEDTGPRESTYLHGVYDDYWTAGDDKPDVPELPAKQPELDVHSVAKQNVSDVPPLSPRKENAGTPPTLGRRFSWEAESEQVTPDPGDSQEKPVSDSQPQAAPVAPVSSSSPALGHEQSPALSSEETRDAEQTQPSTSTMDETHIAVPTTSGTMSHQVSQASSVPRDRLDSENIEPPSPVSAVTDKNHASAAPPRRLSLAEEKSMVRVSSNPVSPSPPPGGHPALARSSEATSPPPPAPAEPSQDQPAAPLKIINFKEIMEIQNASERINKYNETRAQFASMDSGLNNWLVNLKSQHPEHANATASFAANASNVGQPSASPTASQPNSQQPYYQQYLNASSTNVSTVAATATSSGRPPAGSVSMGSHSPGSDFKHSSGQVGAKGKGLLLAAGKAGKGLLSKGKNKLRGTGDKRDSSPPPVQPQSKAKPERRTSWGISLGTRSSPRAASHAHSASFSGSLSGPAPGPQTIPEHPASQTPPPQLPQTSRISPFDALTQEKQASAWAPPRPQTPKHPAGVRRDTESEPVSPVSDTQSMSAPNHHDNADDADAFVNGTGDLQVPRPIGKTQPSWDPFTGTPLVEEEGFEMGQSRDPSPHVQHAPHAAPAAQFHYASTTKNARSDDDWVVVSPQSAPSEQVYVLSPESPQLVRSFQPTESSREIFDNEDESDIAAGDTASSDAQQVSQQDQDHTHRNTQHQVLQQEQDQKTQQQNQLQTRQQLPSQQQSVSPQRQSSFVGLPPIRRSSTFGINLTKRAKKRFSLEEDDDVDGQVIVSSPVSTVTTSQDPIDANTPSLHQHVGRDASTRFAQPARIETGLSASRKDSAMSHQVISATSTQAATLATESTGVAWGDDEKRALDPRHSFRPGGSTPHPIDTKLAMQQAGRTGGGQLGMRSQQGVVSPTIGGNPIQHLPPQGPWKLEESHLSEPLLPASRNRLSGSPASPHQPFFGFDKETGVPSPAVPRQETQLPPRQKFSEVPPSSAQRYPGLFTPPPQGQPNLVSPVGPRSSYDLGHQFFPRDSSSIQRTHTADSEVSSVEPSGDDERGRKRRSSGFFKEIGERFSRPSSRERQSFKEDEVDHVGHPADDTERTRNPVPNMAAGETQSGRQKRRSSLFLNLGGSKPSDTGSQQGQEGEVATPSPKASPIPASAQFQPPVAPAERKRSWLGSAANDSSAALPTLSRSSTSTAGNDQAGGHKAPPKKRFSGFAGKVFNRSSQQELQPPQKPGTSHSLASSFQNHHSGAPATQLDVSSSHVAAGRERSNTTGSGPFGLLQSTHLQTVGEEDRGRRSSAGNLLSGIFGHRSSRNQEAQQPVQAISHQKDHVPAQPRMLQPAQQHQPSNPGSNHYMGLSPTVNQQFGSDQQQSSSQGSTAHSGRSLETQQQTALSRSAHSITMGPQPSQIVSPVLNAHQNHDAAIVEKRHASGTITESRAEPDASNRGVLGTAQSRTVPGTYLMSDHSAQQPPARLYVGQDQAGSSHDPTFSNPQAHALGIQGLDAGHQNLEPASSPRGPLDAIASSSNGVVHAPDTLQRLSISASPPPPPVSQRQPLVSVAPSTTRKAPFADRHQAQTVGVGSLDIGQNDEISQQAPSSVPHMMQQQAPGLGHGSMEQFSQENKLQTQRSSLPLFSDQSQQPAAQGLDDEGQHSSVSKWFKNRTSAQATQLSSHPGHPKESTTKSLFSAFKRSSKQPEARPQQQQQQQQQQSQQMPPPDRGLHAQPFQTRPGQILTPPPGPLNQRNPHPMQGPLAHQQQRHPSPAASFGQRAAPQHSMSSASSEISQGTGRVLQYHRPSGDPIMTRAIPASLGPTPGMPQPQPYQEPQYDQVPIPRGYEAVHGEGHVAPSPYDIGRPSPPAQYHHHQMQPVQQSYAQPPVAHRHPSEVSMYNQSQALAPKDQPQAPSQCTASYQADRRVSTTSYQSTVSHASYGAQPGFNSTHHSVPEYNQQLQPQQQEDPRGVHQFSQDIESYHTANLGQNPSVYAQGHPQLHAHSSRADAYGNNHTKPSTMLQVQQPSRGDARTDFAVRQSVDSPQIQSSHGGGFQPPGIDNLHTNQSRLNTFAEQSSPSPPQTQISVPGLAVDAASPARKGSHGASIDMMNISDAGVADGQPVGAGTRLSVNIQKSNQDTSDSDIYDATPRLPSGPLPPPTKPITATSTGQSQVSESSADEAPRNATHTNGNSNRAGVTALVRGRSTRAELEDTEDERMRTMRLEAQEEKILVDPYEEKQSSGNKYRKEDDPEAPQMSATSYPGQEWNPYGAGGYEEWD